MSAFATHCDICKAENAVPSYGDWQCIQCGQKYEYDESDRISLTDAQWALLRNPPQWIPVTERLPDDGVRVLAWDSREGCARVAYIDSIFYMVGFDDDTPICVSHWMSLPEPPEVK